MYCSAPFVSCGICLSVCTHTCRHMCVRACMYISPRLQCRQIWLTLAKDGPQSNIGAHRAHVGPQNNIRTRQLLSALARQIRKSGYNIYGLLCMMRIVFKMQKSCISCRNRYSMRQKSSRSCISISSEHIKHIGHVYTHIYLYIRMCRHICV